jgi:3-hydroxyisobutyrate dehydrogenase-like beta-hydroxyacid dehydrogenase
MQIGLIGLGRMGLAMAGRLVAQGHAVHGWDVDPARIIFAAERGATAASGPAQVSARSEVILTIVTDDAAVRHLFGSPDGLLAQPVSGRLFVEMSTLQPQTVRDVGAQAASAGARLVGAPVLGTIPAAEEGALLALAGGAAEDVGRARAALAPLTREVLHLGPLGAGNAMKLIVNLGMAAFLEALAEGMALGARHGLSVETMLDVLGQGPIANPWLKAKSGILLGASGPTSLDIRAIHKDVMSAVAAGATEGVPMPMAAGILATLSAAVAVGRGSDDLAELPKFFREAMLRRPATFGQE